MRQAIFALLSIIASVLNLLWSLILQTNLHQNYQTTGDLGDLGYLMLSLLPRMYNLGFTAAAVVLVIIASVRKEPRQRVRLAWILIGIAILAFSFDVVRAILSA